MAKTSLTNFCVVVLKNRRFWRSELSFEKSIQPHLPGAAEGCLSYFKTITGSKEVSPLVNGSDEAWLVILVHEARVGSEPIAGTFLTGGWPMEFNRPGGTPCSLSAITVPETAPNILWRSF
jgi:hypothetical protein